MQDIYWADSGDLVTIASESSFYILKYDVSELLIKGPCQFSHFVVSTSLLFYCVLLSQLQTVAAQIDVGNDQGIEDAFELLHEIPERVRSGIWIGNCFIYNNSSWRLNYCAGREVNQSNLFISKTISLHIKYFSYRSRPCII
jgi:coatomer subunit beta'